MAFKSRIEQELIEQYAKQLKMGEPLRSQEGEREYLRRHGVSSPEQLKALLHEAADQAQLQKTVGGLPDVIEPSGRSLLSAALEAARLHEGMFDIARDRGAFLDALSASATAPHQVEALRAYEQAQRVAEPWIRLEAPAESIRTFARLSRLGALSSGATDALALYEHVHSLMPPWAAEAEAATALKAIETRQRAYRESGLHDLVEPIAPRAFMDVLWETRVSPERPPVELDARITDAGIIVLRADDYELRSYLQARKFERHLRRELRRRLDTHYGTGWESLLDAGFVKRLRQRATQPGASGELLDHTTFAELSGIVLHVRFWPEVFEPASGLSRDKMRESLDLIRLVRNDVAHFQEVLHDDYAVISLGVRVISSALGIVVEDDA